jgi:hypothetical protein
MDGISLLDQLLLRLAEKAEQGVFWVSIKDIHISIPCKHSRCHASARWRASRVGLTYQLIKEKHISPRRRLLKIENKGLERLVYKGLMSPERAEEIKEKIKLVTALPREQG